jgi:predicted double-glycine peptidase
MRETHYDHIVKQQYDYSCGSVARAASLKSGYGIDILESKLIRSVQAMHNTTAYMRS